MDNFNTKKLHSQSKKVGTEDSFDLKKIDESVGKVETKKTVCINEKGRVKMVYRVIGVLSLLFIGGCIEFGFKISAYLPYTDENIEYERQEKTMDKIELFVSKADKAINDWRVYHTFHINVDSDKKRISANENTINSIQMYSASYLSDLDDTWKVYALYFYAYVQFIQADFATEIKAQESINSATKSIAAMHILLENKRELNDVWLAKYHIPKNLGILNAMTKALDYKLNADDLTKRKNAIDALRQINNIELLKQEGIDKDRILGDIFEIAFLKKSL